MIIIQEAIKDTYVNNRIIGNSDKTFSNVGKSSTLDIFKLCNENNLSFSTAKIKIDSDNNNAVPEVNSGF